MSNENTELAKLDANDPEWPELFALRLELAAKNQGCGILEMFGRMMGCKRKDIRRAKKIDRTLLNKSRTKT